jgi:thiamine-phosphate pyrophosphorylase
VIADRLAQLARARLYLVVTPERLGPTWEDALATALATGLVDVVQLREKAAGDREVLRSAAHVRVLCDEHGCLFLLNDRVHLVLPTGADGVHVGEADVPPEEAREVLGPHRLVGLSTHDEREVAGARGRGADHAGLGPCFPSATKDLARPPGGADLVRRGLARAGDLPVFPIGGIAAANVASLVLAGATRVAVGLGILAQPDPAAAVRAIDTALRHAPPPHSHAVRESGRDLC